MLVEKVSYNVDWRKFKRGTSIFIPCLDCIKARRQVMETLRRLKIEVLTKRVIIEGIQGLRIWKI